MRHLKLQTPKVENFSDSSRQQLFPLDIGDSEKNETQGIIFFGETVRITMPL